MSERLAQRGRRIAVQTAWLLAVVIVAAACSSGGGGGSNGGGTPPPQANLFQNPGFEEGREPWISLDSEAWGKPFTVSSNRAHSGTNSALLELRSEDGGAVKVYGVVAEILPEEFPEVLSGHYYVERWEKGTPRQYLQAAVIVQGAKNIPREVAQAGNHQMRYILAGVDEQPTFISNARYVMVSEDAPATGRWVPFELDIKGDFEELWGDVPRGFSRLRILFEVRWDDRLPSDMPSAADVYYDDLYAGPSRS
jgi:hypothetical protein